MEQPINLIKEKVRAIVSIGDGSRVAAFVVQDRNTGKLRGVIRFNNIGPGSSSMEIIASPESTIEKMCEQFANAFSQITHLIEGRISTEYPPDGDFETQARWLLHPARCVLIASNEDGTEGRFLRSA
jgi:hypothetical protein